MLEPVLIHEKISRALRSGHLQHIEKPCDIDMVGALGMAGVSNSLSSAVFRLKYGNEARFYPDALRVVAAESKRLSKQHDWSGSIEQFARINKAVLDYWINDRCAQCEGRGYELIVGAPVLSNSACGLCSGAGKVPIPSMGTKDLDDRFARLLARIEYLERISGGQVIARLGRSVEQFGGVR